MCPHHGASDADRNQRTQISHTPLCDAPSAPVTPARSNTSVTPARWRQHPPGAGRSAVQERRIERDNGMRTLVNHACQRGRRRPLPRRCDVDHATGEASCIGPKPTGRIIAAVLRCRAPRRPEHKSSANTPVSKTLRATGEWSPNGSVNRAWKRLRYLPLRGCIRARFSVIALNEDEAHGKRAPASAVSTTEMS